MARSERLMLRLEPSTYQAIKRFSKASGQSMSALADAILKDAEPSFNALSEALEKARSGQSGDAKNALAAFVLEKVDNLLEASENLIETPKAKK